VATHAEQVANMRPRAKHAQLDELRAENAALRRRITELEALIADLSATTALEWPDSTAPTGTQMPGPMTAAGTAT
jgi:prefoldin subunit 5